MMRTLVRSALASAALLAVAGAADAAGSIRWAKSFSAAMAQAKASQKLVMVDFYTDW